VANYLWLLNDGVSRILLNNGTDKLSLNEEVVADAYGWQQPPSEPRASLTGGLKQRAVVAALAGFVLTPLAHYPGAGDALASTVTTSVRHDKTIVYQDLAYTPLVAEVVTVDKYARPFSDPVLRVTTRQQQELASVPFVEDTTTLAPKWFRPLSEPTRRVTTRQQQELYFAGKPADPSYWFPRLSEPTRVKVRQNEGSFVYPYQTIVAGTVGDDTARPFTVGTSLRYDETIVFQDFAYSPYVDTAEVVTSDKWFAPFSQPRFVKRVTGEEGSLFFVGDGVDRFAWRQPFSQPVRAKPRLEGDYTAAPTQPQANDGIGWHRPLSEPTRRKTFLEADIAFSPTQPQANDGIGWHRPFNEPTRRKSFLEADVAYNPALIEDAGIQVKWFQPFGVPRAAKRAPEFPASFYSPYFVPPISGTGTEFNWWPNLSERLRQPRRVAQQQALIQGPLVPITVTLEYAWHRQLNEPVRRKKEAQTAGSVFNPFPQITIAWHQPLAVPVRRKPITAEEGSAFFLGDFSVTYAWRQPLNGPVRRKRDPGLYWQSPLVYAPAESGVGVGTDQPWPEWSRPTRRITIQHLRAGLMWTSSFVLAPYDPDRVVCVHFESRSVDIETFSRTVTPNQSRTVTVEGTARTVEPDEQSRSVTPDERQSCQES
jgi:hypothetical protein